jgi:30S ribosomal protein S31
MGRGDKRTAKGKRFKGSYGNSRPHKLKKSAASATQAVKKEKTAKVEKVAVKKAPVKKAAKKKTDDKAPE